jgi:hypothetical protein
MTTQTNLKRYYQNGIKIKKTTEDERLVFFDGVYIGSIRTIENWGMNYLARPTVGESRFFKTLRLAQEYLVEGV